MIGRSLAIRRITELIERIAPSSAPVLITGETGTGKERAARLIHRASARKGDFLAVNCAALPETLMESELFGHEKGAFTGADRRREGAFEQASGGTLLLDEITEMKPALQAKLLRVLEQREVARLGSSRPQQLDVRVVAATNRSPERAVAAGSLREDLYYRLNVASVELPPLRERLEDVPLLVAHFVEQYNRENGTEIDGPDQACLDALRAHRWPGNIRELRNVIQLAVLLRRKGSLSPADLPPRVRETKTEAPVFMVRVGATLAEVERELLVRTLASTGGNKVRAAEILAVSRGTLYKRLVRYRLLLDGELSGNHNGTK
jgi:DNA-binding NtrC family response regulator